MNFLGIINRFNIKNTVNPMACEFTHIHKIGNYYYEIILYFTKEENYNIISYKNYLLLGRLFSYKTFKEITHPIKNLNSDNLKCDYWGQYIFIELVNDSIQIFKSEFCQVDLFYQQINASEFIFTSKIKNIFKYYKQDLLYNYDYLVNFVFSDYLYTHNSSFKNIYELPNGYKLRLVNGVINRTLIINYNNMSYNYKDVNYAELLTNVIGAWIKPYKEIALEFSSGLDSSAILYCLSSIISKDRLTAINYFVSDKGSSVEVESAKKICSELGVKLECIDLKNKLLFEPPTNILDNVFNKPTANFPYWNQENWLKDTYFFNKFPISGYGADWIFMKPPSIYSISDAFITGGFKEANKCLQNFCNLQRINLCNVLLKNFSPYIKYKFFNKYPLVNQFQIPKWLEYNIKYNPLDDYKELENMAKSNNLLLAKYYQLIHLINAYVNGQSTSIKSNHLFFYPYLTEPIVKYAMSIPTYETFDCNYDRIIPRTLISRHFNTNNVWKISKGDTTGFWLYSLKENLSHIIETCCDGHISQKGFINKDLLIRQIRELSNGYLNHNVTPIIKLYCLELFLHSWNHFNE